ncbi:hypothetical protein L2747_11740 [Shewanella marinintestina]|uniref:hypothetical protein n=1 Tax=Shewanella marinintestina TaxID=190305 RepID=UPI00200DC911|nr:hypothetical protein [Shewanella marinintestina]MCL1146670.1 hypothetical protein [Shewanella marinintestina]
MKRVIYLLTYVLLCASASASASVDSLPTVNKYSDMQTFGSVIVQCPIDKTWKTVDNVKSWFESVLGDFLVSIKVTGGNRELETIVNYEVDTGTGQENATGQSEERLIVLSDYNYQLVTTFNRSTLPLMPWTTKVTLEKVTFIDKPVDYTLIKFSQSGSINVPPSRKEATKAKIQKLFNTVFAPSLKEKFDGCS